MSTELRNPEPKDTAVLLSIKPEYAEQILRGDKPFEYRKQTPSIDPPYPVYLYATKPRAALLGKATCVDVLTSGKSELIENTANETPQSFEELGEYFDAGKPAHALALKNPVRYDHRPTLFYLRENGLEPAQNFRYAEVQEIEELIPWPRE